METFSALLSICAGNSPVTGEFLAQRPVTRSSVVFFDLRLNKHLSKQSRGWWFEMPSRSLWRHCHEVTNHIPSNCNYDYMKRSASFSSGMCPSAKHWMEIKMGKHFSILPVIWRHIEHWLVFILNNIVDWQWHCILELQFVLFSTS